MAGYDLPQNLSISGAYELPIGRGRLIHLDGKLANNILGGWQANAIYAYTSGQPFSLSVSGDYANTGNTNADRPDKIGNPHLDHPNRNAWFNTQAYTTPALYSYGTSSRNELRGQHYHNMDASLFKSLNLGGEHKLQFRLEGFNVLNHLTLGQPTANVNTTATFGMISGERSTERQVQVAVKFVY